MNGQLDLLALAVMAWEAVSWFLHSDIARWMLYFLLGQWLVRVYIRIGNARVAPLLEELRALRDQVAETNDALQSIRGLQADTYARIGQVANGLTPRLFNGDRP
jgi:hypothetical protein